MEQAAPSEITRILLDLRADRQDDAQTDKLFALLYDELRRMAARAMARERSEHTLQATALLHEAFLKLVQPAAGEWQDRAHFLAVASRAMRQILVDHARARRSDKRGGAWQRVTLTADLAAAGASEFELIELDRLLSRLADLDPRIARVAEMRVLAGMEIREIAHALSVSPRTVDGDWATARMWLAREMGRGTAQA
jgi:RNA polymerase sigma factor (TIGR02999 family)